MSSARNTSSYRFKVCLIGAFHGASGTSPTSADLLRPRLRESGIEVVWASKHVQPIHRLMSMLWILISQSHQYRVIVLDVYSGRAFLWAFVVALMARILRKRLIMWLHGGNLPDYYRMHRRLVSFTLKQADKILAPSLYLAKTFQPEFDIGIMRYQIPVRNYPYKMRVLVRPRLFWLRAFNRGYNPMLAPYVAKQLLDDFPDLELIMCGADKGDGSLQATQQLARDLGLEDHLRYPGLISKAQIQEFGQDYDIFLNTTTVDNSPVSVIEAMAMGMCVVSTNVGGMPFLITDGQDGLLVPSDDAKEMAKACRLILTEPALAQRISRQARITAEQFDWESIKPQWEALLTQLHNQ